MESKTKFVMPMESSISSNSCSSHYCNMSCQTEAGALGVLYFCIFLKLHVQNSISGVF